MSPITETIIKLIIYIAFWSACIYMCKVVAKDRWKHNDMLYKTDRAIENKHGLSTSSVILLFILVIFLICLIYNIAG